MHFWSLHSEKATLGAFTAPSAVAFDEVRAIQLKLVELRAQDLIEDTILFLEHEPVVTQGRGLQQNPESTDGGQARHMPVPMLPVTIAFSEAERGGDLTYHGPGQLVVYPICKLDGQGVGPSRDVGGFIRTLERIVISDLNTRLEAVKAHCETVENATGVWIRPEGETNPTKKIASIGIAIRKWVTYHGLAINCVVDLSPFQLISPCGFKPEVMTRLQDFVPLDPISWRSDLEKSLAQRFKTEDMSEASSLTGEPLIESLTLPEVQAKLAKIEAHARSIAGQI